MSAPAKLKYLTDDINELDAAEHDLEANGIPRAHIHILSNNDAELERHDLPAYSEWSKRDIAHFGVRGALIGISIATLIFLGAFMYGITEPWAWMVLAFTAVATVGFCAWEGGLVGMNMLNHAFIQYREDIASGQHLLVVDAADTKEEKLARYTVESHPVLRAVD